jgi:alpha-methylacyl-CoA racemase
MEKLGLGPEVLLKDNPRLIYARLTGFGSTPTLYSNRAGHDINYIATSGVLSMLGRANEKPHAPVNFAADFAGGGLLCAFGICVALLERTRSGQGQVVDSAMVDGSAYVASWLFTSRDLPIWGEKRGQNALDGGAHFYDTYATSDGRFMAVGALEPQFYVELLKGLELDDADVPQFANFDEGRRIFDAKFRSKSQAEWCAIFDGVDACVTPVVEWSETNDHQHNRERGVFTTVDGVNVPNPAPRLSRTPGVTMFGVGKDRGGSFEVAEEVLGEVGIGRDEIERLLEDGVLKVSGKAKL